MIDKVRCRAFCDARIILLESDISGRFAHGDFTVLVGKSGVDLHCDMSALLEPDFSED